MSNDFTMKAGDDKVLAVTVRDEVGAVVNLTGCEIRWQMARRLNGSPVLEKAIGDGITVTNAVGGLCDVVLDHADTEDLSGDFMHEMEIIDSDDKVSTVLSGAVAIERTVIKPAEEL